MSAERQHTHSFLVRLWQPETGTAAPWYAMLEDPHSGKRRFFVSPAALFRFIEALLDQNQIPGGKPPPDDPSRRNTP